MDEQMKESEDVLQKKLLIAESSSARGSSKAGARKKK